MQSFSKFLSLIYLCHVALIVSLSSFLMHFVGYPCFLSFVLKWILFLQQQQVLACFVFHVLGGTACYRIYNIQYQYDLVVLRCTGQFIYLYIHRLSCNGTLIKYMFLNSVDTISILNFLNFYIKIFRNRNDDSRLAKDCCAKYAIRTSFDIVQCPNSRFTSFYPMLQI